MGMTGLASDCWAVSPPCYLVVVIALAVTFFSTPVRFGSSGGHRRNAVLDWLRGAIGLLLAVPLTAFVKLVADCHPVLLPISNLLAERPRAIPRWALASGETVTRAIPFLRSRFRVRQKQ